MELVIKTKSDICRMREYGHTQRKLVAIKEVLNSMWGDADYKRLADIGISAEALNWREETSDTNDYVYTRTCSIYCGDDYDTKHVARTMADIVGKKLKRAVTSTTHVTVEATKKWTETDELDGEDIYCEESDVVAMTINGEQI